MQWISHWALQESQGCYPKIDQALESMEFLESRLRCVSCQEEACKHVVQNVSMARQAYLLESFAASMYVALSVSSWRGSCIISCVLSALFFYFATCIRLERGQRKKILQRHRSMAFVMSYVSACFSHHTCWRPRRSHRNDYEIQSLMSMRIIPDQGKNVFGFSFALISFCVHPWLNPSLIHGASANPKSFWHRKLT